MPDSVAGRANSCRVELWAVAMSARSAWVRARSSGASRMAEKERHPVGGALCAKAQSDSLVVSIYSATYKSSEPIHPT